MATARKGKPVHYLYEASDLEGTETLGRVLAQHLPAGTTIALCGTLGAGKTRLVQALATACGVPRETVVSPTFVLCQEYHGQRTIYHFDVYRLHDEDEFLQLGPEEYFDSTGLTIIEWADRILRCLPPSYLRIDIDILDGDARQFSLTFPDTQAFEPLKAALLQRTPVTNPAKTSAIAPEAN
jgi:tRNA threonylcarbamoyladenosine biosynthesis protein TsaE